MQARKVSEPAATPIQLSLRIRHPDIDPEEISTALGLTPEHCFKAGESRSSRAGSRSTGRHSQTYWLAPVTAEALPDLLEPTFLAAIAARNLDRSIAVTAQDVEEATRKVRYRNVEALLLHFLAGLGRPAVLPAENSGWRRGYIVDHGYRTRIGRRFHFAGRARAPAGAIGDLDRIQFRFLNGARGQEALLGGIGRRGCGQRNIRGAERWRRRDR